MSLEEKFNPEALFSGTTETLEAPIHSAAEQAEATARTLAERGYPANLIEPITLLVQMDAYQGDTTMQNILRQEYEASLSELTTKDWETLNTLRNQPFDALSHRLYQDLEQTLGQPAIIERLQERHNEQARGFLEENRSNIEQEMAATNDEQKLAELQHELDAIARLWETKR